MAKYSGTIKSFNPQKGWGFIECPETQQIYGKDIFVMKKALPDGFASKGDRVRFEVAQGQSGPEAAEVDLIPEGGGAGGGGAQHGEQLGNAIGSKAWAMSVERSGDSSGRPGTGFLGYVKSYVAAKGWGFVTSDDLQHLFGKDIFFMKTSLRSHEVSAGDRVRFSITQGVKGLEATDIHLDAVPNPVSMASRRRVIGAGPHANAGGLRSAPAALARPALPALPAAPAAASSTQMLFGTIKGYNPEKGWGHIDCDAARQIYGKDVFLMRSALGEQSVQPGTMVSFRVVMAAKGPHAADVHVLPDGCISAGGGQEGFFDGVVKSFNAEKGWGFITSEEITSLFGKDIFLHKQELGGAQPEPGDSVHFTVEPGKTGQLEAKNVTLTPGEQSVPNIASSYRGGSRRTFADQRARPY